MARLEGTEYTVTTPNMDYVPQPHVGLIRVDICEDFRYGIYDPVQWPQVVTKDWEYLPWVRRRATAPPHWWPVWWTPRADANFEVLEGSLFTSLGLLRSSDVGPLRQLVKDLRTEIASYTRDRIPHPSLLRHELEMQRALERLIHFPLSFRDICIQLRQVQRSWLFARAFLDHSNASKTTAVDVNREYMGGFSTNPDVVQKLYTSGIPVWFLRLSAAMSATKTFVATEVTIRHPTPDDLVTKPLPGGLPPVYRGLTSANYLAAVTRSALSYMDLSHSPLLVRYDAESNCAQAATAQPSSSTARLNPSGAQRTPKQKGKHTPRM